MLQNLLWIESSLDKFPVSCVFNSQQNAYFERRKMERGQQISGNHKKNY